LKSEVYRNQLIVPASAIDELQHVNNVTYLQWCLDAAENHWVSKADKRLRKKYVWVVLNHEISYKIAAFEGEKLEIKTWVKKSEGVKSERHYKIVRLSDNKTLVEAKTIWCLLDGKTHRPTKITEEITTLFLQ
jgi:acyl-CoA thioester hydrolase